MPPTVVDKVTELAKLATFAQLLPGKHPGLPIEVASNPPTRLSVKFGQAPQGLMLTIFPSGPNTTLKLKTEPNAAKSDASPFERQCTPKQIILTFERILRHYKQRSTWLEYNHAHGI